MFNKVGIPMISLVFCGDFAPINQYENLVIKKGSHIFGELLKKIDETDISFINLETPVCNTNSPILKSGPTLKSSPDCLESLAQTGFTVIGLANNHILDHGQKGFLETLENCQKYNLNYVGVGKNIKEAQEPFILEVKGIKIGIIAVTEQEFCIATKSTGGAAPLDPIDNTYQIEKAKKDADLIFVTIHGGNEYFPYPRPGLRRICKYFIDRGVDGVICHHPHVAGAYEFYKTKPIVYSLGNIIFDMLNPPPGWFEGYAIQLDFNIESKELIAFEIIPYLQSVEYNGVKLLKGEEKGRFIKKIEKYRLTLYDPNEYEKEWNNFCSIKEKSMLIFQFLPINSLMGLFSKFLSIEKLFLSQKSVSIKLNLIRCDSHRELLQFILEKIYNRYKN